MLAIILLSSIPLVFGHGGMLWPPSWQNGQYKSIDTAYSMGIASDTQAIDPTTNRKIRKTTAFLPMQLLFPAMAWNMQWWKGRQTRR
jgi:hypothetical protein